MQSIRYQQKTNSLESRLGRPGQSGPGGMYPILRRVGFVGQHGLAAEGMSWTVSSALSLIAPYAAGSGKIAGPAASMIRTSVLD